MKCRSRPLSLATTLFPAPLSPSIRTVSFVAAA